MLDLLRPIRRLWTPRQPTARRFAFTRCPRCGGRRKYAPRAQRGFSFGSVGERVNRALTMDSVSGELQAAPSGVMSADCKCCEGEGCVCCSFCESGKTPCEFDLDFSSVQFVADVTCGTRRYRYVSGSFGKFTVSQGGFVNTDPGCGWGGAFASDLVFEESISGGPFFSVFGSNTTVTVGLFVSGQIYASLSGDTGAGTNLFTAQIPLDWNCIDQLTLPNEYLLGTSCTRNNLGYDGSAVATAKSFIDCPAGCPTDCSTCGGVFPFPGQFNVTFTGTPFDGTYTVSPNGTCDWINTIVLGSGDPSVELSCSSGRWRIVAIANEGAGCEVDLIAAVSGACPNGLTYSVDSNGCGGSPAATVAVRT